MEHQKWAFAAVCPRGIGPTKWAEAGSADDIQIRRRFALIGQTLDGMRVWDVRRACQVIKFNAELATVPLWLQGKRESAPIALYAGVFEPDVARFDLWHPPATHKELPTFLNVRKHLDLPQGMALAFPRPIKVYVKDESAARAWDWTVELQRGLTEKCFQIRVVGE